MMPLEFTPISEKPATPKFRRVGRNASLARVASGALEVSRLSRPGGEDLVRGLPVFHSFWACLLKVLFLLLIFSGGRGGGEVFFSSFLRGSLF